jgi:hypothetical protein
MTREREKRTAARARNDRPGVCHVCDAAVPAGGGRLYRDNTRWDRVWLVRCEGCHAAGWGSRAARDRAVCGEWTADDVDAFEYEVTPVLSVARGKLPHPDALDRRESAVIPVGEAIPAGWEVRPARPTVGLVLWASGAFWVAATTTTHGRDRLSPFHRLAGIGGGSKVLGRFLSEAAAARLRDRVVALSEAKSPVGDLTSTPRVA